MKALSLFSGIGGLDLAAEAAGMRTVAMCEIDPFCRKVLRRHWPDVPIYEDVFKLTAKEVMQYGPRQAIDIIFGGFPCQPFSVAGKQEGKADNRYLWPEFSRLVGEIKPRWVVAENVPGILSIAADDVCEDLERQGYKVGIFDYEATAIGALHRRERVFFVGHTDGVGLRGDGDNERPERIGRRLPDASQRRETVSDRNGTRRDRLKKYDSKPDKNISEMEMLLEYSNRPCNAVSDAYREQRQEQQRAVAEEPEFGRAGCRGGRISQPGLGRVAYGIPFGLDGLAVEPDIPRVARGVKDRVARLRALGNAVVPAQAYPIFRAIVEIEREINGKE